MSSRYTRRLTSVRFEDAAGLGMTVGPGEGNFSMGQANYENAEHVKVFDRDQHDGFVLGQDEVQEFSITVQLKNQTLTSSVTARILDFIHKRGLFANASSMDSTIWAWKTIVTMTDSAGTVATRTLSLCEGGEAFAEGSPSNTIAISGRSHSAPVDT
jgi:hypothetical protein